MLTHRDSVYSTGITAKTAGSKDRYRSISGRQPYSSIGPCAYLYESTIDDYRLRVCACARSMVDLHFC